MHLLLKSTRVECLRRKQRKREKKMVNGDIAPLWLLVVLCVLNSGYANSNKNNKVMWIDVVMVKGICKIFCLILMTLNYQFSWFTHCLIVALLLSNIIMQLFSTFFGIFCGYGLPLYIRDERVGKGGKPHYLTHTIYILNVMYF